MDNDITAIERAFDLAKSGTCATLADIKAALKAEGYSLVQITGPSLSKQLRALIDTHMDRKSSDPEPT